MTKTLKIDDVPEDQRTPLVVMLFEIIELQREQIQQLRDEIARLKGQKPKPEIKPSKLVQSVESRQKESNPDGKRPGSEKRSKNRELKIHENKVVRPDIIPEGSKFKGFVDYVVQDLVIHAGRIMLKRLHELAGRRADFAFESTLASRSFAPWISELKQNSGYLFYLIFLWLPSPEMAVNRVRERVRTGGHNVSEDVVRRRYEGGLRNFFGLYRSLMDGWSFYDNATVSGPRMIASGTGTLDTEVHDPEIWAKLSGVNS